MVNKRKLENGKSRSAKSRKVMHISDSEEDSSSDSDLPIGRSSEESSDEVDSKYTEPLPKRDKQGYLRFPDYPDFRPNLTPKEVLHRGSFGGTYFRNIQSGVLGKKIKGKDAIDELPKDWFKGLNLKRQVCSQIYDPTVNKYGVRCGGGLDMWEGSGWIAAQDPFGWFQWYCHFYLGRRTSDDSRQVSRGKGVIGDKGRWRNNLIGKIARAGKAFDDYTVSPVIRQALQHWGYDLTEKDAMKYVKKKGLPPLRKALGTKPNARHYPSKRQGLFNPNTMDRV